MAVIETAFDIGDVVYHATIATERRQHPCPDCHGSREWKAISPAGGEFAAPCPRCTQSYISNSDLNLSYSWWVPSASRLTIGSVRANTERGGYDEGNSYMCLETGVGSGSVYRESELFHTEAEALAYAETKAALNNADAQGWVAKQYAGSLKFCDYELRDALIKSAEGKAWSIGYDANNLAEEVAEATTLDDAKAAVTRWQEREQ